MEEEDYSGERDPEGELVGQRSVGAQGTCPGVLTIRLLVGTLKSWGIVTIA